MPGKNQNKTQKSRVGRPLRGTQKRVRVSFTLLPPSLEWLRGEAARQGKSRSEVMELAIEHFQRPSAESKLLGGRRRLPIPIPREAVADFSRRHHIKKLSLFGSILTDRFGPESDVDILVEFEKDHVPGLLVLAAMEKELGQLLGGRKVDIKTPQELSRYFRKEVIEGSEPLYAA